MANEIRIKRRAQGGAPGAPTTLRSGELAYNEQDNKFYYGFGDNGSGLATSIIPIGGPGAFADLVSAQSIGGAKTFVESIIGNLTGNATTATTWATPRNLTLSGDASATLANVDGSQNVNAAVTLPTVNSNVGTFSKLTVNAKGLVTAAAVASLSELSAPTGPLSMGTQRLIELAAPTANTDATNKAYVDSVAQGLAIKDSVRVASTGNLTLSGEQTIDGAAVVTGERVLVKDQTAAAENGLYIADTGAWARSPDADTWDKLVSAFVFVQQGAVGADTGWVCTVDPGGTLGANDVTFAQFSGAGSYTAGTGLELVGNEFRVSDTAVTAGAYGAATKTLLATVNAQGQIIALSATDINVDGGTF